MRQCKHLGMRFKISEDSPRKEAIHACALKKWCTLTDQGLKSNGTPMAVCEGCTSREEVEETVKNTSAPAKSRGMLPQTRNVIRLTRESRDVMRATKQQLAEQPAFAYQVPYPTPVRAAGKFCYVTGSNRRTEPELMRTMIHSARMAGVPEDFHCFATSVVPGATSTRTEPFEFDRYMFKFELMRRAKDLGYDYYAWVDPDNFFAWDPGTLEDLIRDEPCWVGLEGNLTSPNCKHLSWWGIPTKLAPSMFRTMGARNKLDEPVWNCNAGMFVVRRDSIDDMADQARDAYLKMLRQGYHSVTEEPPLAVVGQAMVSSYLENVFDKYKRTWVCDWSKVWSKVGMPPDGRNWRAKDWVTGEDMGDVNPAIVHMMSSKHVMRQAPSQRTAVIREPVGTKLEEIFDECGIRKPEGCSCDSWIGNMNRLGVTGCEAQRGSIIGHLNAEAEKFKWYEPTGFLNLAKVVVKGYLTTGSMLDEAMRRAIL